LVGDVIKGEENHKKPISNRLVACTTQEVYDEGERERGGEREREREREREGAREREGGEREEEEGGEGEEV
jgi:hypothetical protein